MEDANIFSVKKEQAVQKSNKLCKKGTSCAKKGTSCAKKEQANLNKGV